MWSNTSRRHWVLSCILEPTTPIIKLDLLGSTVSGHGSNTALLNQPSSISLHMPNTVQTDDTSNVPSNEALGGSCASLAKKREIDDNSRNRCPCLPSLTAGTSQKLLLKSLFSSVSHWTTLISILLFKSCYRCIISLVCKQQKDMAGEALLGAIFGMLLDRLTSKEFINFFRGRKHDESLLKKLKLKLLGLNKVLNDAEDKQITDRAVKDWLDELKDAIYHAEDLVDEIATAVLRCKVEAEYQSGSNQVQSLISSFTILFDDEIDSKLERMIDLLEDFTKEKDVLGLKEVAGQNWSQRLPTTSLVDESCVYGRENDKEEIMKLLLSDGESLLEKSKNNRTMEDEGYECFRELLSRSFFQRSNAKDFFVMHDLVHDLAQSVAGDFCYKLEDGKPCGISENVRHFSYVRGRFDGFDKFKVIKDAKCLRTFLQTDRRTYGKQWLSKKVLDEILSRLTHLRVLSLPRYQIEELPYSISKLIHLRFLDLSYNRINQLPESVCSLYNLETLLLPNCHLLTTLPAELVKLILLRNLDLTGTNLKEMPMHISRLKNLQQLTAFVVGKCSGSGINELKELHSLRGTITIAGLENVTGGSDALEAKLREKKHLEKLVLKWGSTTEDSQKERNVLEKLEPHKHLKHLEIQNYRGTKFPTWLGDQSFCKMESLHLENCEFCFSLPPLGQLPSLKELTIARMPYIRNVGHEFYGESGSLSKPFESLETLHFEEMLEWMQWIQLDAGEFSQLQKLEVVKCPNLIGDLPQKVPSLVRLEIKECPGLVASLERATCVREVVLEECKGVQLEWKGVYSVETLEISSFASLEEFARELSTLTNLKELKVEECPMLLSFPKEMMSLHNLEELSVLRCPKLELPVSVEMSHRYTSLEKLTFFGCERLKSLPLGLFPKLQYLKIQGCINFETLVIPEGTELQNLTSLQSLDISGCNNMVFFPCGGLPAPNMSCLHVFHCKKLKALPEQMHTLLPSLQTVGVWDCPEIVSFPKGGLPSKVRNIGIGNCKKLLGGRRDWGLQTLPSLTRFALYAGSEDVLESFPEEWLLPSTLTTLWIKSMPNLKSLNNRALQLLGSLKYMEIRKCPQLQSLPEEGLSTSLFALQIERCPLLKPRCRMEEGEDWHKIAHIPLINIDGEAVFDGVHLGPVDVADMKFATPPVFMNVEKYQQPTLGVQRPGMGPTQLFSATQPAQVQPTITPADPPPTVQTVDTSNVPGNGLSKDLLMTLTRLFTETSEGLGGSRANPVKKREIEGFQGK
ncbi:hypothetical protein RHSIM_Rhsim07G0060700 [Rhododendron simsii]|uniref:Rx N-terminal domain-containing protein n=1 Tax=Rhododendron simsii TaxID=118357 RepID=A0A834GU74_RHOSS|nr:hypothetical protein RHSIM_Rhsim07G0060700 [Rhododendron simsii]